MRWPDKPLQILRVPCLLALGMLLVTNACSQGAREQERVATFDRIGPEETIHFGGTEPFWGGTVAGKSLEYATPDNPDGTVISVERFAGNNGLGYSGTLNGQSFDLAVTPGTCSDGMSDRTYPFVATLQIDDAQFHGCAWTEARPASGPTAP